MPPETPHITPAELNILKVLWQQGSATVGEVRDVLAGPSAQPAYTTVMTLMNQLAAKGVLDVDRSRQPFVYKAAIRRERVLRQRIKDFVHGVFDGQAGELVMRLVEEGELSAEDLKRIEAKIAQRESTEDQPRRKGGRKSS